MNNPLISVILPFFNAGKSLSRSIASIAHQTYENIEIILINNNSTDDSLSIAYGWVKKDDRIRIINEPRQGVAFASNAGSKEAKGTYIARMDADDETLPDRLKIQADFLEKNPDIDAVGGLVEYTGKVAKNEGMKKYVDWANKIITAGEIKINRFIDLPVINPTAMWRKEAEKKYGLFVHGDFPEDYEMWLRWMAQGANIAKVNHIILKWHDSENRLTRTNPSYRDEAFYMVKTKYLYSWLQKRNPLYPSVNVWGASKISRKRAKMLENLGINIDNYIDIKKTRQIDTNIIYHKDIPPPGKMFILVYVRQWNAKKQIKQFLQSRGYSEGKDYLFIS
ncbi:MAG: glycosyltransferase [Bacteroidales bacterium]